MSCTDPALESFYKQRSKKQLMLIPKNRFQLQTPYGGKFTKRDFDRRRKAEVLKHKKSNFQTNQNTIANSFTQIIRGKQLQSTGLSNTVCYNLHTDSYFTYYYRQPEQINICTEEYEVADDGVTRLMDVPLYNYNIYRNYSILEDIVDFELYTQSSRELIALNGVPTEVANVYTINCPDEITKISDITIPVNFYIHASVKDDNNASTFDSNSPISIRIGNTRLQTKFNDNLIQELDFNPPTTEDISLYVENASEFHGELYVGNITLNSSELSLDSTSDYVYDLFLQPSITISDSRLSSYDVSYGFRLTPSSDALGVSIGCDFEQESITPIVPMAVVAESVSGAEVKTNVTYIDDVTTKNILYPSLQGSLPIPSSTDIYKDLTQHIWLDVITYNNQRKIMLRNINYRNNTYYVEDGSYNPLVKYQVTDGDYYIVNISQEHPIALLNATRTVDNSGVITHKMSYQGNNLVPYQYKNPPQGYYNETYQISDVVVDESGENDNGTYNFFWKSIRINVAEDFGNAISFYCSNHGYMGGEDLLHYRSAP